MNILHISRPDRNGAGVIAYTIHEYLLNNNFKSKLIVLNDESPSLNVISMIQPELYLDFVLDYTKNLFKKIKRKIISITKKYDLDYCPQSIYEQYIKNSSENILDKVGVNHDVIILYFLDDFINAKIISELYHRTGAKVYWFLMDMAAMTGGCHYAWDCSGFKR